MRQTQSIFAGIRRVLLTGLSLFAGSILLGWLFEVRQLLQFVPTLLPMQANTALCFLLLSLALRLVENEKHYLVVRSLCAFVGGLSLCTISQYLLKTDFGIDTILGRAFFEIPQKNITRMSINGGIAFALCSIAIFRFARPFENRYNGAICLLSTAALMLGVAAVLGYLFDLDNAYAWSDYTQMTLYTSLGACLLSTSIILTVVESFRGADRYPIWLSAGLSCALGFVITLFIWAWSVSAQTQNIASQLHFDAQTRIRLINYTMSGNIEVLTSIERFFASTTNVDREEYRSFTLPLLARTPSLLGISWLQMVPDEERDGFEQELRREGFGNFRIFEIDAASVGRHRGKTSVYAPVTYTEPYERNQDSLGFDYYSDPLIKQAMDQAARTGEPVSSSAMRHFWMPEDDKVASDFIIVLPVFEKPAAGTKTYSGLRKLRGFVLGLFRAAALVNASFEQAPALGLNIEFHDVDSERGVAAAPMYVYRSRLDSYSQSGDSLSGTHELSHFARIEEISFLQHHWQLIFTTTKAYLARHQTWHPWALSLAGILVSFLFAGYIYTLQIKNDRVISLVSARTAEIEERKQIEERLREGEERFRSAIAAMQEGLIVQNRKGVVQLCNRKAEEMFGYASGTLVGNSAWREEWRMFDEQGAPLAMSEHPARKALLEDTILYSRIIQVEIPGEGKRRWFSVSATPLYGPQQSTPYAVVSTFGDITDRAEAEKERQAQSEELAEKNTLLARATEFKSQFLANMSHEIRTPLTSIIGYTETLMSNMLSGEEKDSALETVLRNGKHLLRIINDILDLSKIEAGKLTTESIPVNLFDLISDVGNLMQHRAMEQGLAFGFEYDFPIPRIIKTDPTRLKQILFNLVGNAIKFTKKGGVKIHISFNKGDQIIKFAVIDTGVGLSQEQQGRLFKAFSQADTSTTREFGGTGLGLVISHQLAAMLGGGVTVSSEPNKGSVFTVAIATGPIPEDGLQYSKASFKRESPSVKPANVIPRFHGSVLLVEDGEDNQKYISFVLRKTGLEVTIAENGAVGMSKAREGKFDIVLMDMQMPVMDGYTATKNLRAGGYNGIIVALSANIMASDVEKYLTVGCDRCLGKPFERSELYSLIEELLPDAKVEQAPLAATAAATQIILTDSALPETNMQNTQSDSVQMLLPEMEDDDPEMLEIIMGFVERLPERVSAIAAAIEDSDWGEVAGLCHKMRGAGRNYPALLEISRQMERHATAGEAEKVREVFVELDQIEKRMTAGRESYLKGL